MAANDSLSSKCAGSPKRDLDSEGDKRSRQDPLEPRLGGVEQRRHRVQDPNDRRHAVRDGGVVPRDVVREARLEEDVHRVPVEVAGFLEVEEAPFEEELEKVPVEPSGGREVGFRDLAQLTEQRLGGRGPSTGAPRGEVRETPVVLVQSEVRRRGGSHREVMVDDPLLEGRKSNPSAGWPSLSPRDLGP